MLYASTKATLKQEFGTSHIKEDIHCTTISETTLEGYLKYKKESVEPAPLTMREEEMQEIRRTEVNVDLSVVSRHQTLSGVAFPITEAALQAIKDMERGSYDYLQFRIGEFKFNLSLLYILLFSLTTKEPVCLLLA